MTRTVRSIATNLGARAAITTSTVLYSAFGKRSDEEYYRPFHLASLTHPRTSSIEEDVEALDPETWELRAATLRPEQDKLFQEESDAREADLASLHQLHTFGKYAQRSRTHRHGITRDNPDHHIVHLHPPVQDVAKSQKGSIHNASSARRPTWEQETGVIRSASPTLYEYSASVYSRPTCEPGTQSIRSRPSLPEPVDGLSPSHESYHMSGYRIGVDHASKSPLHKVDQKGNDETYSSDGGSNASSLKRRGAVRRRANPLFARPVSGNFERNEITGQNQPF